MTITARTAAALAAATILIAAPSAAVAAPTELPESSADGFLVLASDPYPAVFRSLSPGEPAYWFVDARLTDATTSTLTLEVEAEGALIEHPRGLQIEVRTCTAAWDRRDTVPTCPGAEELVIQEGPATGGVHTPVFDLAPLAIGAPRHLLVTLAVEDSPAARSDHMLMGLTGDIALGLTASGDETLDPGDPDGPSTPTPGDPDDPTDKPQTPDTPDTPEVPGDPDSPDTPGRPGDPDGPSGDTGPGDHLDQGEGSPGDPLAWTGADGALTIRLALIGAGILLIGLVLRAGVRRGRKEQR